MTATVWICVFAAAAALCGAAIALWCARSSALAASSAAQGQPSSRFQTLFSQLTDRVDELQPAVEGLLNREKMRRVRQGAGLSSSNEPDPHRDPSGWKAAMRRKRALIGGADGS